MSAVRDYAREHAAELVLDLGSTTEDLRANPGDKQAWASFGIGATKGMWSALPASVRAESLSSLDDAIGVAKDFADLGVTISTEVLSGIAGSADAIPIVGGAIKAVLDAVGGWVVFYRVVQASHEAYSRDSKNIAQWRTFLEQAGPSTWAAGLYPLKLYEKFYEKSDRIDGERWRLSPCIAPSRRDAAAWGLGWAEAWEGECIPGRPLSRSTKGGSPHHFEKKSGTDCSAQAAVSALFWPFWSPNHVAEPIRAYSVEGLAPLADPNEILVARQQALLSHAPTNMRVRGDRLRDARSTFTRYFRDQMQSNGGMLFCVEGEIPGMHAFPTGLDPTRFPIDSMYREQHAHGVGGFDFYWHANGTVGSYGTGPDLTEVGVPAMGAPLHAPELAYTAAQLNAVVTGVKAFFTARTAMLEQPYAMQALLKGRPSRYDPRVRAAIRESAESVK